MYPPRGTTLQKVGHREKPFKIKGRQAISPHLINKLSVELVSRIIGSIVPYDAWAASNINTILIFMTQTRDIVWAGKADN